MLVDGGAGLPYLRLRGLGKLPRRGLEPGVFDGSLAEESVVILLPDGGLPQVLLDVAEEGSRSGQGFHRAAGVPK